MSHLNGNGANGAVVDQSALEIADTAEAKRFLEALGKNCDNCRMRFFLPKDHPKKGKGTRKTNLNLKKAADISREGFGVYIVIGNGGDEDNDITSLPAVFVDDDDGRSIEELKRDIAKSGLPPASFINFSGKRGHHAYWILKEPITNTDHFRRVQEKLIGALRTDKVIKNPSRVMRLPGYRHVTFAGGHGEIVRRVDATEIDGELVRYDVKDIESVLPDVSTHAGNSEVKPTTDSGGAADIEDLMFLSNPVDVSLETAKEAIARLDPDCDRDVWLRVAMGLKNQFPDRDEDAFRVWHEWSACGILEYEGEEACRDQWVTLKANPRGRKGVTILTVLRWARDKGWDDTKFQESCVEAVVTWMNSGAATVDELSKHGIEKILSVPGLTPIQQDMLVRQFSKSVKERFQRTLSVTTIQKELIGQRSATKAEKKHSEGNTDRPFECYYDSTKKEYLIQNPEGRWSARRMEQMLVRLRKKGVSVIPPEFGVSQAEQFLLESEDRFDVTYAAPLAGRRAGFYDEGGVRFLVTESPHLAMPRPGNWDTIRALHEGLYKSGDPVYGQKQLDTYRGWLQTAVKSLREGRHQQAQAVAVAGPRNSGKSLEQNLRTYFFGGRAVKAVQFMTGITPFNADLFEAEHLILDDEFMSTRIGDRLKLGQSIKNLTVSTMVQSCHRKGCTPVSLRPWWRVSISLNDNPESLRVLPPLNEDTEDKIILLRSSRFKMPMPTDTSEDKGRFWAQLVSEIPAFLHWLLNEFTIPDDLRDSRYVVSTFHHPFLVEELGELSPETHLLRMIDTAAAYIFTDGTGFWEGTADTLRARLIENYETRLDASRVLEFPGVVGTYLGRLAKAKPYRVVNCRTKISRLWKIYPEPGSIYEVY